MLNFIITGFLIGLFVSIPVGPIAVLCIQRTLNKGRWYGFATGLGAAFSDMMYALVAGFGMSIVISVITNNQLFIQMVGSVVICVFGIYIFRSNPLPQKTPIGSSQSYLQDFFAAFFMTITNPMIIFLFIGLYARFNFIYEDIAFLKTMLGILAVFLGAASWWFVLVSIVNLFRNKFNVRSLGVINKIMGSILAILAIAGFVMAIMGNTVL